MIAAAAVVATGAVWAAASPATPAIHSPATASAATARGQAADPASYDASIDPAVIAAHTSLTDAERKLRSARLAEAAKRRGNGMPSEIQADLGAPRFLWAGSDPAPAAFGPLNDPRALAGSRARDFLRRESSLLGLTPKMIDEAQLYDVQAKPKKPSIARFRQTLGGREVFNRDLNVMMDRSGSLVAISGYFAVDVDEAAALATPAVLSPEAAIVAAFRNLGGSDLNVVASHSRDGYQYFAANGAGRGDLRLDGEARLKPVYFPLGNTLVPAFYLELSAESVDGGRQLNYGYVISGIDGSLLFRKNQRAYDTAFNYRVFADTASPFQPYDGPLGTKLTPYSGSDIYAAQPRISATANLVALKSSPLISTGDPWLADNATITSGNNVDAYLDLFAPNGYSARAGDIQPATTAATTFDYAIVADENPADTTARNAAAVNLFYVNNWLHDFWYDHGFDESAGNAQVNNYGRGGVGNDPIDAEGQDYSGTNNANMSTPADGGSPRMQMYLWSGLVNGTVDVTIPPQASQSLPFSTAAFGPAIFNISGSLVLVDDGVSPGSDACSALVNGGAISGHIAVIDRGSCNFQDKVMEAQNVGASAVIMIDNVTETPITMGAVDNPDPVTVGSVMVTLADGNSIKAALTAGTEVTATLDLKASTPFDGTLDNQVISHEHFHYVSNRLVGNGSGLSNNQGGGMGEGWSDFDTMLLTVQPEDVSYTGNAQFQGAYPTGYYVYGSYSAAYYFGIRRTPYSTDFSIDPLTYTDIQNGVPLPTTAPLSFGANGASNAEVHNTGEIWTNILWGVYASLLDEPGVEFDDARGRMQDYIIGGLKLTPDAPTLNDARDGILATVAASNCADFPRVAAAFAVRGMGANAVAPPSSSTDNVGVVEDYMPATAETCAPIANAGPDQSVTAGTSVTLDGSASVDPIGETLSFQWKQTAGSTIALSDAGAVKPTFSPSAAGTYVFELTVTDTDGLSASDDVTITAAASSTSSGSSGSDSGGGALPLGGVLILMIVAVVRRCKNRGFYRVES